MKGLVVSKGAVDDFPLLGPGRDDRFVGDEARETLFMPDRIEGVRGVLASDRALCRDGVFGLLNMLERITIASFRRAFQLRSDDRHALGHVGTSLYYSKQLFTNIH